MCCNWHVRPHKLADREGVAALARPRRRHCNKPRPSAVECRLPSSHSFAPERRLSLPLSYLFLLCRKKPFSLSETRTPNNNEPIAETGEREQSGEQESEKATSSEMPSRDRADRRRRPRSANILYYRARTRACVILPAIPLRGTFARRQHSPFQ